MFSQPSDQWLTFLDDIRQLAFFTATGFCALGALDRHNITGQIVHEGVSNFVIPLFCSKFALPTTFKHCEYNQYQDEKDCGAGQEGKKPLPPRSSLIGNAHT